MLHTEINKTAMGVVLQKSYILMDVSAKVPQTSKMFCLQVGGWEFVSGLMAQMYFTKYIVLSHFVLNKTVIRHAVIIYLF